MKPAGWWLINSVPSKEKRLLPVRVTLILCISLFSLLAYLVYLYLVWPVDTSDRQPDQVINVLCPLQEQICRIHVGYLELQLSLSPKGLPVLEMLSLEVLSLNKSLPPLTAFKAWFEGRDMPMGKHAFTRIATQVETIRAQGMIPFCSIDSSMIWQLSIEFLSGDKYTRLLFDLPSARHLGQ